MKLISKDDARSRHRATEVDLGWAELADHLAGRNRWVSAALRTDGGPQMSLVTGGMIADAPLAIATYLQRTEAMIARGDPHVSVDVMGSGFNDAWVQIDGQASVLDTPPDAVDAFVEYRQALEDQGTCMVLVEPTHWIPLSKRGFPLGRFGD